MTRAQEIRDEVLLQLKGAGQRLGLTSEHMSKRARREGEDFSVDEILEGALFLVGQGFAERMQSAASGEIRFRITSKGVLEFESNHD